MCWTGDLARSRHSVKDVYDANGDSNPTLTQEAIFLWLPEEFGEGRKGFADEKYENFDPHLYTRLQAEYLSTKPGNVIIEIFSFHLGVLDRLTNDPD